MCERHVCSHLHAGAKGREEHQQQRILQEFANTPKLQAHGNAYGSCEGYLTGNGTMRVPPKLHEEDENTWKRVDVVSVLGACELGHL